MLWHMLMHYVFQSTDNSTTRLCQICANGLLKTQNGKDSLFCTCMTETGSFFVFWESRKLSTVYFARVLFTWVTLVSCFIIAMLFRANSYFILFVMQFASCANCMAHVALGSTIYAASFSQTGAAYPLFLLWNTYATWATRLVCLHNLQEGRIAKRLMYR